AFTKGGSAVLSGSHDRTVKRTSLATGQTEWQAPGHFEQVNAVALSKDAALLATGTSDGRYAHRVLKAGAKGLDPGAVRLWDARTGRLLRRLGDPAEPVMAVAVMPDGRQRAGGGAGATGSGVVRVWETATGKPVWSTDDHAAEVLGIAYAPDGSSVVTAAADGLVKVRDPKTGAVLRTLEGHDGGVTAVAFSADGTRLVCGQGHGGARVWEARTGRLLQTRQAAGSPAARPRRRRPAVHLRRPQPRRRDARDEHGRNGQPLRRTGEVLGHANGRDEKGILRQGARRPPGRPFARRVDPGGRRQVGQALGR